MKNNKRKNWLAAGLIIFLVVILIFLISSSKNTNDNTNLNLSEKKWIENKEKEVINISIANGIPVFSNNGEGVFFDFIDYVKDKTKLSFNLIPYDASGKVQKNSLYFDIVKKDEVNKLKDDSMVFYKDYYVLVGKKDEEIVNPNEITNKKIGVLQSDLSDVNFYLASNGNSFSPYDSDSNLKTAFSKDEVNYIAVPKTRYYSYILSNNFHVVYNLTELKEAYVLKTSGVDNNLSSIINKKFREYKKLVLEESYDHYLSSFLLEENKISEKSKDDFSKKKYVYGYVVNNPYNDMINNRLIGLDSKYLNLFSDVTGTSFTYKRYRSVKDLADALSNGEVDFTSSYYSFPTLIGEYTKTDSLYQNDYVVLVGNKNNDLVVNSAKSLSNKKVIGLKNSLSNYFKEDVKANVITYDKVGTLLNKIDEHSIIVLDANTYNLYKNKDLSEYKIAYFGKENVEHGFIIKNSNSNSTFAKLFSSYVETLNYKQINNQAWKDYASDSKEVSHALIYSVIIILVVFVAWLFVKKKINLKRKTKHDQIVRYIDPLTSLKNRHYLNKNFSKWENNAIYPQAIIVINLNNLRHVNDVYGHEEGDKLLKQAANILIKNQLEQSDIIRTDGNEYLIYMVGYEKNKVVAYMRKLYKELADLPYGFGATLGYSMIEDDIKTIDDAINEAVLEIRASKEMKNKR